MSDVRRIKTRQSGVLLSAALWCLPVLALAAGWAVWSMAHAADQPEGRRSFQMMGVAYDVPTSGLFALEAYQYHDKDWGNAGPGDPYLRDEAGHLYVRGAGYGRVTTGDRVRISADGWVSVDGRRRGPRLRIVP